MPFQVSPGVEVREFDLTTIIPAVSTTRTGFAGFFNWGPLRQRITVTNQNELRKRFGDPDNGNFEYWFTAANFLNYGANLQLVRVVNEDTAKNSGNRVGELIKNLNDYTDQDVASGFDNEFIAKFPGGLSGDNALGNGLAVAVSDNTRRSVGVLDIVSGATGVTVEFTSNRLVGTTLENFILAGLTAGVKPDVFVFNGVRRPVTSVATSLGNTGPFQITFTDSILARDVSSGITNGFIEFGYAENFNNVLPNSSQFAIDKTGLTSANDLINIAVIDKSGFWSGEAGTVLETFDGVSKAPGAKDAQGNNIFYKDVIRDTSSYIYVGDHFATSAANGIRLSSGSNAGVTAAAGVTYNSQVLSFVQGLTGGFATTPDSDDFFTNGFELFEDPETVDISILLGGPNTGTKAKQIVTLLGRRKDALGFFSPTRSDMLTSAGTPRESFIQTANIVAYRNGEDGALAGGSENHTTENLNVSSSYCVLDSGYKQMFDRFNDVFRYVPLNGDIAGIAVRSDFESEPWFSPAGFNRGQVQNVTTLALNPNKTERDALYQAGVNPVISQPGQGTVLFGDKTLLSKPSAFDRINVRRLFIVLEKAISTAAKFSLFELNDRFTRAQFKNLVEPFLLDVQSRRGITDFRVICDESNNTGEVIDRNEFVADIFIQPTRSINFITLNFIATRTGVDFSEIQGVV